MNPMHHKPRTWLSFSGAMLIGGVGASKEIRL